MKFETEFNQSRFQQYTDFLKASGTSQSTIDRKFSSLNSFQNFLVKKGYLTKPVSSAPVNFNRISTFQPKNFLRRYLIFGTLIAIILGLGYGLYTQTILKAKQELAYSTATSPVTPGRVLSFQGRLTDTPGNPISSPTNIVFKFYNGSVGGTELYSSSVGNSQSITPDENGIFNVVIGKTHGTEIPSSVFSENAEVWLEITADSEIMDPRQQIATVAYALNSETLQGLPPSASGLKDTVLVIDGLGNLNLGETSPTIKSTSGIMAVEGQALLLKASDSSGGNITINPDGNGIIRFLTEGTSPSSGGFIDLSNNNIAGGNLINSQINNTSRGYNFISFQNYNTGTTQLSTRFSIDSYGSAFLATGLTAPTITLSTGASNGFILQSDANGNSTWVNPGSAGIGTSYDAGAGLTKTGSVFSLNVGYTNTWLAPQFFTNGIGVTGLASFTNNIVVGGTFVSVGSTNLVSNLNAQYLNGHPDTYFLTFGDTGPFIQSLTNGVGISISGTGIGRTIAVDYNATNLKITGNQLDTIQSIAVTAQPTFARLGLGATSANYTLNVVGNAYVSTSLTVGTSLSVGTTTTTASLNLTSTAVGGSSVAAYLSGNSGFIGYLDTSGWDKSTADDYAYWVAKVGNTVSNISTGNTLTFTAGTGIGMTFAGNNITINSVGGIGTTYAAGIGLTLSDTNVFALNLGYTNVWLAPQYFTNGIGVTGNSTFQNNLTIGGTFVSVGSSSSFLQVGGTGFFNAATNGLQAIGVTGVGLGGTLTQTNYTNINIGTGSSGLSILGINNNTQALTIRANGRVGIGNTNPQYKLSVTGDINLTEKIYMDGVQLVSNTGVNSLFIGNGGLGASAATNSYNTAVGMGAMSAMVDGDSNTAIGANALASTTWGLTSVAVGANALYYTTVSSNDALGYKAGYHNVSGQANVFIGQGAGVGTTQYSANYNTIVGYYAANNLSSNSNNNTMFGYQAGYNIGSGADANVFLGYRAGYSEAGSNKLYIANNGTAPLIYGDFSTNRVGIGTTAPTQSLDVNGSINIGGSLTVVSSAIGTGTTALFVDSNGLVTKRALGSMAFDSGTYDNYQFWNLLANSTGSTAITSNANVNFVNGVGISLSQSGSTITINNSGIGTTYSAGVTNIGVTSILGTANQIIASGSTGAVTLSLPQGIGTTSDVTFRNLTLGGTFVSVGSTNLVSNLNAQYLNGHPDTYFVNTGQTAAFIYTASNGITLAGQDFRLNLGYTNAWLAPQYFTNGIGVTGNSTFQNSLSIGGSLGITSSLTIGSIGSTSDNNRVLTSSAAGSGILQYLDTTSWDKSTADDYSSWLLQSNGANTTSIGSGTTVNFVNGVGISLSQSGSTITINNSGIGTTYSAGVFVSVGSTNLVSNLNAQYLNGHPDTYFLDFGDTGPFIQSLTNGVGISISGTGIGRTIAVDYNTTNLKITSNELDTIQSIAVAAQPTFARLGLGATSANYILNVVGNGYVSTSLTVGTSLSVLGNTTLAANLSVGGSFLSVGTSNLVTNLNADLLDGKHSTSYLQVGGTGFFNTATNGLQMIGATAVGLGGTLTQLTKIDQNNFNFSFFGSGNVGIGTTSPGSKLHVVQSGTGRGDGIILSASGNNWYQFVDQSDAFNIFYNSGQKLTINGTGIGIGITNPTYKLHVVGDAYITTSLTVGTSLSVLGNLTVGGTSYTGDLNINKPNSVGGSYVAAFVGTGTTGFLGYVDTTNWDKSTSDDYAYWVAKVGNTVSNISTGNTLTFTAGTGIGMTFAGNNITINSVGGIGTTYAAGIGLTLSDTNVFALNLGYTNAWLAPQYFTNGIGVTGNSTFQNNLTIGGTFISVGSTNLVTNLNANYLGGISSTGFLQIGQTGSLPYVNDATDTTLTRSGTGPYTLALNLGSTNAWTAQQNFIDIGVTGYANFQDDIIVGGAIISVGQTNLVTNLNANYLSGYAYNNLPYFNTASNGLSAINTNTVGLGGTLTQNTIINNSNYNLSFLGLNSEQSLYVSSMGYVGIGTTDPNHNFEVNGSAYFSNSIEVGSSVLVTNLNADMLDGFHSWDFITNITAGVGITIIGAGNTRVIAFDGSQIGNMTFGSGSSFTWTFDSGATTSLINFDNGFIGIGTTSAPRTTLEVNGTVAAQKFVDLTGYEQYFMDLANSDYNSSSLSLDRRGSIKWNATYNSGWKTIDNGVASKIENRANGLLFATSIGTTTAGSTITDWNQSLFIGNSGHVGIGNTNPQSVLELSNSTSTFTSLAGDITFNAGSGNISLNGGKLSNLSAVQTSSGTSLNPSFSFSSDTTTGMFSAGIGTLNLGTGGTTRLTIGNSGFVGIGTASPLGPFQIAIGDTQALFVNSAGLIGIGTTSPGGILHLSSTGDVLSIIAADTDNSGEEDNPRLELRQDDNTVIGGLGFVGSAGQIYTGSLANSMYLVNDFASALQFGTNNTANVTILSDGNVGIGTTSPISTLHVNETSTLGTSIGDTSVLTRLQQSNGNANYLDITQRRHTAGADWAGTNVRIQRTIDTTKMGFIDFGVNGSSSNYGLGLGVNASTFLTIAANGSVGIGTTSPSGLLHVEGSSTSGLVFIKNLQTGYTAAALTIQNMSTSIGITGGEFVRFLNSSGTKVGRIRTNVLASSVAYSLSGTADFAEYVIASEPTEAGDLIAFSDNKYIKASSDNSLAGIHSFDPSFVGNENIADQPNALPLALSGIVKLKVSSINGPINPGDSLTASSIKGIASKAISAGYIAAKAIDSYNSSDPNQVGLINVIVNLGWYDPDVFITENGQVAVNYNVSPEVLASLGYSDTKNEIETASYSLTDSTDKIITKIGLFAQISAAKINTGLLSAKNIIVDNLAAKKIASETIITGNITATTAEISDLTANQITANEASFSSIYADQIINPEGNISDVFAAKITALRDEIKTIIAENQATPSALLADSTTWDTSVSTDSADLTLDNLTLSNDLIIGAQLTVQGLSKFTSANVSDIFTVGQIALQDNILETTSENLYIQPSGLGTIHFLNDRLVLSSDGNVTINGNLNINGSLIANLLKADNIETKNLTAEKINIATSSAIIADSSLASLATSSAQLSTNATVGTITLAAGQTEITIQNNQLTSTSMVYLTPTSSTQNQVPYLKSKDQDTFTIAIDQALNDNVNINWWLIN